MAQSPALRTWVVLPAYNEERYIIRVLERLGKVTTNIIVVDDGSSDKTVSLAKKHSKHVLEHSINLGKGAALTTGCDYAFKKCKADAVIFLDSDDQHDPELIPLFIEKLHHFGAVFGVRSFDNNMPLLRIFLNRFASVLILVLFGKYIPDIPCGYKAITHKTYKKISWKARDYAVEMEIAARVAQYQIPFTSIAIPTIYHDLDRGMNFLDTLTVVTQLLSWRLFK